MTHDEQSVTSDNFGTFLCSSLYRVLSRQIVESCIIRESAAYENYDEPSVFHYILIVKLWVNFLGSLLIEQFYWCFNYIIETLKILG